MKSTLLLVGISLLMPLFTLAQNPIYPVNGVRDTRPEVYLFTNATVFVDYQTRQDSASLLIRDGVVEAVGRNLSVPDGAQEIDLAGKFIYPGLIDLYSDYGLSEVPPRPPFSFGSREQLERTTEGPYNTNDAIKSQYRAVEDFQVRDESAEAYRKLGFGVVLTNKRDGLARGTSALVSLSDEAPNQVVLRGQAGAHYSFDKGSSSQYYPISKMGFLALLRQTYLDADWYPTKGNNDYRDESLEAWIVQQDLPQFFDAPGWIQMLRADHLGDEFGVQYILRGNGDAYQRLDELKATNAALIVPLTFPDAYDVSDPYDAEHVVLQDMMHWELAPTNAGQLAARGIDFALTADGLTAGSDFWKNLRQAIRHGLSEEAALRALTDTPARLVKAEDQLGSLQPGRLANFIITSDNLFDEEVVLYENWIQGKPFVVNDRDAPDLSGNYSLQIQDATYPLEITGQPGSQKFSVSLTDTAKVSAEAKVDRTTLTLAFPPQQGAPRAHPLVGLPRRANAAGNRQATRRQSGKLAGHLPKQSQSQRRHDATSQHPG